MNFTGSALLTINNAFNLLMTSAPRFYYRTGRELVSEAAAFSSLNPNASSHEIAIFLGSSQEVAASLCTNAVGYFPGSAGRNVHTFVEYLNSTLPHLPNRQPVKPAGFDALIFTLMGLVFTVVSGRIFSRHTTIGSLMMSDWIIVVATAITITFNWMTWILYTFLLAFLGYWEITQAQSRIVLLVILVLKLIAIIQFFFTLWIISLVMLLTIKTSLLLFYHQLSTRQSFRTALWVIFGLIIVSITPGFFGFIFLCQPVLWWTSTAPKCIENAGLVLVFSSFVNFATDFALWVIPLPLLFELNITRKERNWAVLIFGLGLLSCAAGGMRTWLVYTGWVGDRTLEGFMAGRLTLYANIESQLAVICASIPAWRPLARKYAPRLVETLSTINRESRILTLPPWPTPTVDKGGSSPNTVGGHEATVVTNASNTRENGNSSTPDNHLQPKVLPHLRVHPPHTLWGFEASGSDSDHEGLP